MGKPAGNPAEKRTKSIKQLEQFMKLTPDAVIVTDVGGVVLAVNDGATGLFGWEQNELLGQRVRTVPDALMEETIVVWNEVARNGQVYSYETVRQRKDGQLLPVNLTIYGVRDRAGEVLILVGVARDVSNRTQLEDTVRQREWEYKRLSKRYQSLFDNSPDAVMELNLDGEILHGNIRSEQLTGYTLSELKGLSLDCLIYPDDVDATLQSLRNTQLGAPQTFEMRFLCKNRKMLNLAVKAIPITEDDDLTGIYAMIQDITAQKKAEKRLEGQRQILDLIAQGAPLRHIYNLLIEVVEEQTHLLCSIVLVDENQKLRYGAGEHLPRGYVAAIDGISIGPNVGSCGTAAYLNETVVVRDIATDSRWDEYREIALQHNLRSCWSIPIRSKTGLVIGTFAIYGSLPNSPEREDLVIMETYGRLVSVAMEQHNREREVHDLAYSDSLTRLPNRRLFIERLFATIHQARRHDNRLVGVMSVDLDRFKFVNDSFGHAFGDEVLQLAAQRIHECLGNQHTLARVGGDEFSVLLPDLEQKSEVESIASRIIGQMTKPFVLHGHEFRLTASIGIALYPQSGEEPMALLKNAESAMYVSKNHGKNSYKVHLPSMSNTSYERLKLEADLQRAIEQEEFFFHYQPKVHMKTGMVTSAEALIRWNHPTIGLISPGEFIPLAEETGLIVPLGNWILKAVGKQIKMWKIQGFGLIPIAVNVSAQQFEQADFAERLEALLRDLELDPCLLEIEITETTLMHNEDSAGEKLARIKDMGIRVSIDDFGTGYSTLGFLKHFPLDALKIDQSFIQDMTSDANNAAIVAAIIKLGHIRHLNVVAEGVESDEQRNFLRDQDCDEMQGYLFSRPISAENFERTYLSSGDVG